jgi:hypothetical protein
MKVDKINSTKAYYEKFVNNWRSFPKLLKKPTGKGVSSIDEENRKKSCVFVLISFGVTN